jgi:hypothetical protein
MMVRTQISLENELQKRARKRAGEIGISFAEYVRRLVAEDLSGTQPRADISQIFDLGSSGGSKIAEHKQEMIAQAFHSAHPRALRKKAS